MYPPVNKTQPDSNRFPQIPKVPEAISQGREVPKGTKDLRRFFGEEHTHTELVLKQFAVVAISGGQLRSVRLKSLLRYIHRKGINILIFFVLSTGGNILTHSESILTLF